MAENGHWDLVDKLIGSKADVLIPDHDKTTILKLACRGDQENIAKKLTDQGCDLNAVDGYGISGRNLRPYSFSENIGIVLEK